MTTLPLWPNLVQGDTGKNVSALQCLLSKFESVIIDGSFGPSTVTALKSFQKKMELTIDGFVGLTTWQYLFGYSSYPNGGGTSRLLSIPSRTCCWNQFYTGMTALTGSGACTITTALDLINFYGPDSYAIKDIKGAWTPKIGMSWGYNFGTCGSKLRVKGSSEPFAGSAAFSTIRSEIDAGHPVIINIGTGNSDNHTVMCYGYTNGGTAYSHFKVMDPAYWEDKNRQTGLNTTLDITMSRNNHPQGIWCIRRTYSA